MTEPKDTIAFLPDTSYVIPARLVKQLVEAAEPQPEPSAVEHLLNFLRAAGIEHGNETTSCGNPDVSQVWFSVHNGWEIVFEFDAETGDFKWMGLDS